MVFAAEDDVRRAAHLLGASQEMRRRAELPIERADGARLEGSMGRVRPRDGGTWDDDVEAGSRYTVDEALAEAESAVP
jgi:hypothetical protein